MGTFFAKMGAVIARMREVGRTGSWVNRERLWTYPTIFLIVGYAVLVVGAALGGGRLSALGSIPVGTDFLSFFAASRMLLDGRPADAYDLALLHEVQKAVVGENAPVYGWLYPPMAFLVVAPLAILPYLPALVLWLVGTAILYVSALVRTVPSWRTVLPAIAFPGVFLTSGHGQNAMLTAAILSWGLILLRAHPWIAGAVFGLLVFKPQLGLMLPVAFLGSRNWRAATSTLLSALAMSAASLVIVGRDAWTAFLGLADFSARVLEEGLVSWEKMISAFAACRLLGASVEAAWAVQAVVSLFAAALVWRCWHSTTEFSLKAASLALGTLLATPFALDYEATFLGVALAALVADGLRRGFLDWERTVLAVLWMSPFVWRTFATGTGLPLGFPMLVIAALLLIRRARRLSIGV